MFFDSPQPSTPVKIIRDSPKNFLQKFDYTVEVLLLRKTDENGYFNSVKANLRLKATFWLAAWICIAAALATLGFAFLLVIGGTDVKLGQPTFQNIFATMIGFIGIWGGLFWREKTHIHKKWEYLAGLYNEVIKLPPSTTGEYPTRDILLVALAQDTLKMEMWAHDSYAGLFRQTLERAIKTVSIPKTHGTYVVGQLSTVGIPMSVAQQYLLDYQKSLLNSSVAKAA